MRIYNMKRLNRVVQFDGRISFLLKKVVFSRGKNLINFWRKNKEKCQPTSGAGWHRLCRMTELLASSQKIPKIHLAAGIFRIFRRSWQEIQGDTTHIVRNILLLKSQRYLNLMFRQLISRLNPCIQRCFNTELV